MEAHSLGVGDSLDEVVEELTALVLTPIVGVLSLTLQDGEELGSGFEEATALTDTLEGTVEESGSGAVTIGQQPAMVAGGTLALELR